MFRALRGKRIYLTDSHLLLYAASKEQKRCVYLYRRYENMDGMRVLFLLKVVWQYLIVGAAAV